jgi:hypothetical protein
MTGKVTPKTGDMILNHNARTYTQKYIDLLKLNTKDANLQGDSKKMTAARVATYIAVWLCTLATAGLTLALTAAVNEGLNFSANREFSNSTSALVEQAVLRTKITNDRTKNENEIGLQKQALSSAFQRSALSLTGKARGLSAEDTAKLINDGVAYIRESSNGKLCADKQAELEKVLRSNVYSTATAQMAEGLVGKDLKTSDVDQIVTALKHLNPAAVATRSDVLCALQKAIGAEKLVEKIAFFTAESMEVLGTGWQSFDIGKALLEKAKTMTASKAEKQKQIDKLQEEIVALGKQFNETYDKVQKLTFTGVNVNVDKAEFFVKDNAKLKTVAEDVAKNATSANTNAAELAKLFVELGNLSGQLNEKTAARDALGRECGDIHEKVEKDTNLTAMRKEVAAQHSERLAVLREIQSAVAYVAPVDISAPVKTAAVEIAKDLLKGLVANGSEASLDAAVTHLETSGIRNEIHGLVWVNAGRPMGNINYGSDNINRAIVGGSVAVENLKKALSAYITDTK